MVNGRRLAAAWPSRAGRKENESSAALDGMAVLFPITSATVAKRSAVQIVCGLLVPALTRLGHRTRNGTRWPPSKMSALCPRQSALGLWPLATSAGIFAAGEQPLSVAKMTIVFSVRRWRSSACSTWPTTQSVSIRKSPYLPRSDLPCHGFDGTIGV